MNFFIGSSTNKPAHKNVNNNQISRNTVSPMKESLQEALKKQLANDNRSRGPPPPTPNRNVSALEFIQVTQCSSICCKIRMFAKFLFQVKKYLIKLSL